MSSHRIHLFICVFTNAMRKYEILLESLRSVIVPVFHELKVSWIPYSIFSFRYQCKTQQFRFSNLLYLEMYHMV